MHSILSHRVSKYPLWQGPHKNVLILIGEGILSYCAILVFVYSKKGFLFLKLSKNSYDVFFAVYHANVFPKI